MKAWAENHWLVSIVIVFVIVVAGVGTFFDGFEKIRNAFPSPELRAAARGTPTNQQQVGRESVAIGRVSGAVGDRSVVIGPTDSNGNITLNQPMAVGYNAQAGPGSIAIGANARAGTFVNNAYPSNELQGMDKKLDAIIRHMQGVQKDQNGELTNKFQLGYILFSVTDRKQIVPLNSPMDEILSINWKSGYDVSMTESHVTLRLPEMAVNVPGGTVVSLTNVTVGVLRRIEPWARPSIYNNGQIRIAPKLVSTNDNILVVALGIQSPPEPRPPIEELRR